MTDATQVPDIHVFAREPAEMQQAQSSLILWSDAKAVGVQAEIAECREQLAIARKNGWQTAAWERQLKRAGKRYQFYRKLKAALEAGYYIVPPFPVQLFAIRTNRHTPDRKTSSSVWSNHEQGARLLPPGDGRYVSPIPEQWQRDTSYTNKDGKRIEQKEYYAHAFEGVDFPFKLAKPQVLSETARAMALKVFDQMGILPAYRAADPIIVGQIKHPEGKTAVTFFVAWWLDTRDL